MISWFYDLLSLSLSVTPIIILLLWLHSVLKRRYSARWRYILWIAISIRLLLPFSFANLIPVSFKVPATVASGLSSLAPIDGQLSKINAVNLPEVSVSLGEVLLVIYFVGVITYLAHEIFSYIGFRQNILRWSRKPSNDGIETILIDEKHRLKIKRNIPVRISKKVSSPMLVGLVNPTLILPAEIYPHDELRMILTHELVHLRRNDIWFKAILMVTAAIHWFNPAVYFMLKQANKDMEQSCDDYVLKEADVDAKKFYCNIILKMAILNNNIEGPVFSTNIISNKENLESRIKDIFDNTKKRRGILVLTMVILLVIISGAIVTISSAEQLENLSTQKEFLDKPIEFKNENGIEIKNENINENEVKKQLENKVDIDEINQPQKIKDESGSENLPVKDDKNSSKSESSQEYSAEKQEEIIVNDDRTEIVIVDLNQLENQLDEGTTVDKPEDE